MPRPEPTTPPRAAIVYNPIKVDAARLRHAVALAESTYGWAKSLWFETSIEDPGRESAEIAVAKGVRVVLAAGGDGTVRSVAEGLRGTGVAIALVPSGTGNLLARNLGLDMGLLTRLESAVETAFGGYDHAIDMGIIDVRRPTGKTEQHSFLVMAGLGLDAKMIANTDPKLKKRVGWLAYVGAIWRSLIDTESLRIRYRLDAGDERTSKVHTILVGNCGSLPGNILLLPDAEIDDGILDVVTLRPEGLFGWVSIWVGITWENGVLRRSSIGRKLLNMRQRPVRTLRYLRGRTLQVQLDRPEEFEVDGDECGQVTAFQARIDPASLVVRMPQLPL